MWEKVKPWLSLVFKHWHATGSAIIGFIGPHRRRAVRAIGSLAILWLLSWMYRKVTRLSSTLTDEEQAMMLLFQKVVRDNAQARRKARDRQNKHFLVSVPRRRERDPVTCRKEDELRPYSLCGGGSTSTLLGRCVACRKPGVYHDIFKEHTGVEPTFLVEEVDVGFKVTLEAAVPTDDGSRDIKTIGYGTNIRQAKDYALRDFAVEVSDSPTGLTPWICTNCEAAINGKGPDTSGMLQRLTEEEYNSVPEFEALRAYGQGFVRNFHPILPNHVGATYTTGKTVRPFDVSYNEKVAQAADVVTDSPYIYPTGTADETIGAYIANRA